MGLALLKLRMQGETMVYITTINLTMKTRLTRVGVGGNGLRRIRAIIMPMRPTTCLQHLSFPPYCAKYDEEPFSNLCLGACLLHYNSWVFKLENLVGKNPI
jgi:hypothetical protein